MDYILPGEQIQEPMLDDMVDWIDAHRESCSVWFLMARSNVPGFTLTHAARRRVNHADVDGEVSEYDVDSDGKLLIRDISRHAIPLTWNRNTSIVILLKETLRV